MPKNTLKQSAKTTAAVSTLPADFVKHMEEALLKEKQNLEKELAKFNKKDPEKDGNNSVFPNYGDSEEENAAEVADYIVNLSLEDSMERALRDVNQALERIKADSYGMCKYCGKAIEKKRLFARPTSSSCMTCKKAITQEA